MSYTDIRIEIKYSTKSYVWLCFRHAAQEAMRGENVNTDVITPAEKKFYVLTDCILCAMGETKEENRMKDWYDDYRKNK